MFILILTQIVLREGILIAQPNMGMSFIEIPNSVPNVGMSFIEIPNSIPNMGMSFI